VGGEWGSVVTEREVSDMATRYLKYEIKRAGLTYLQLADRLKEYGLEEPVATITTKLYRGTFSATFMVAVLSSLGLESLNFHDLGMNAGKSKPVEFL
jgi:hypothetical protein